MQSDLCKRDVNIYLYFRFGLANAMNDYQRLKIRVVSVSNF